MTTDPNQHEVTRAFYEANAKRYFNSTVHLNMTMLYTAFLAYMPTYASILDAGCGSGRDSFYFASRGYQVTAFDYSPSMVKLASGLIGQNVLQLLFQEMDFDNQFNGVWACSSLIHLDLDELKEVISKLSRAMVVDGVMYASFKYGSGQFERNGIRYYQLDEDGAEELIGLHPELNVIRIWKTSDLRPDRSDEKWLNLLVRKTGQTQQA